MIHSYKIDYFNIETPTSPLYFAINLPRLATFTEPDGVTSMEFTAGQGMILGIDKDQAFTCFDNSAFDLDPDNYAPAIYIDASSPI